MFSWKTVAFSPQQSRPSPTKPCLQIQCPPTQWASRSQCRHSSVNTTRIRFSNTLASNFEPQLTSLIKIERVARWRDTRLPPCCLGWVPISTPFAGCVSCCLSPLVQEVYFPDTSSQKPTIPNSNSIWNTRKFYTRLFCDEWQLIPSCW